MTVKETKSSEGLVTVLGVVGGLMGSALLGVLLNPPAVLQQPSQAGVLGMCAKDTAECQSLQTAFSTSASLSFALVMLSVIMCLGVAMRIEAWIGPALVFFQFSLWGLAAALLAAAWMLLPDTHAKVVTAFMALLVAGSLWALREPLCLGYYMLFRRKGVSDILHWTLQGHWGIKGFHIVSRASMVRVLLSCGADVNAVQHHSSLPVPPLQQARMRQLIVGAADAASDVQTALGLLALLHDMEKRQNAPWWQFWKRLTSRTKRGNTGKQKVAVTPLLRAVTNEDVSPEIVHLLLDEGANVVCKDTSNDTPLHLAVYWSRPRVVQMLLEHGAKVNKSNRVGATPLLISWFVTKEAVGGKDPGLVKSAREIERILVEAGADMSEAMELGQDNLLFQAAAEGDLAKVRHEVLDAKEDINQVGRRFEGDNFTPLMIAVKNGHLDVVSFLLSRGADIEKRCAWGFTALMIATAEERADMVELLLEKGAQADAPVICPAVNTADAAGGLCDERAQKAAGLTPLWLAAKQGNTDIVRLLLSHNPNLEVADRDGDTPLMLAAQRGSADIVRLLVENGANIYKHSRWYVAQMAVTAATYAAGSGHVDTLRILMDTDARRPAADRHFDKLAELENLRKLSREYPAVQNLLDKYDPAVFQAAPQPQRTMSARLMSMRHAVMPGTAEGPPAARTLRQAHSLPVKAFSAGARQDDVISDVDLTRDADNSV